jgi:molybdopterin-guanine dinucleotide biosynthesis protein MobB
MRVFGIVGACPGRTELVARLVAEVTARGLRVSTIKRVPDALDLDRPHSGTWAQRDAGAAEVMLASATRIALLRELPTDADEPDIDFLLGRLAPVDLVLLDGFRLTAHPKLEYVRRGQDRRMLALDDPSVLAVTADDAVAAPVPLLPVDEIATLADFVLAHAVRVGTPELV